MKGKLFWIAVQWMVKDVMTKPATKVKLFKFEWFMFIPCIKKFCMILGEKPRVFRRMTK